MKRIAINRKSSVDSLTGEDIPVKVFMGDVENNPGFRSGKRKQVMSQDTASFLLNTALST
jgi:hypothetical protein